MPLSPEQCQVITLKINVARENYFSKIKNTVSVESLFNIGRKLDFFLKEHATYARELMNHICEVVLSDYNPVPLDTLGEINTLLKDAVIGGGKWMHQWIEDECVRNKRLENLKQTSYAHVSRENEKIFSSIRRELEIKVREHNLKATSMTRNDTQDKGKTIVIESMHFDFIINSNIRKLVERDYNEIQKCLQTDCWKSVIILSGGCIEGILYDLLKKKQKKAMAAKAAQKGKGGNARKLEEWDLSPLIDTALELKLIHEQFGNLSHAVRNFRNFVHPCNEVKTNFQVSSDAANIASRFLSLLIHDLQEKNDRKKMLKLKGKLVISPDSPKVYIIDGPQKRHIASPNYLPDHLKDKYEVCSKRLLDKFYEGKEIHDASIITGILQKYSKTQNQTP